MRIKQLLTITPIFLISAACVANPAWKYYKDAQTCHFKHEQNCEALYLKVIDINNRLPGIHSSYGAHLISQGKVEQGVEELKLETRIHPQATTAVTIINEGLAK